MGIKVNRDKFWELYRKSFGAYGAVSRTMAVRGTAQPQVLPRCSVFDVTNSAAPDAVGSCDRLLSSWVEPDLPHLTLGQFGVRRLAVSMASAPFGVSGIIAMCADQQVGRVAAPGRVAHVVTDHLVIGDGTNGQPVHQPVSYVRNSADRHPAVPGPVHVPGPHPAAFGLVNILKEAVESGLRVFAGHVALVSAIFGGGSGGCKLLPAMRAGRGPLRCGVELSSLTLTFIRAILALRRSKRKELGFAHLTNMGCLGSVIHGATIA